jgi:hypothetical protein
MKKASIFVVWGLFFFTGCESGGDAHRSGAAPVPSAEGMISDGTSAKEPGNAAGGKEAVSSSQLDQALELQSGVYGLPFGATTDEVMKWCADNNMTVANPTEKDVKDAAKKAVDRVRGLKEAYDFEIAFLTPLEQELLKLAQGYADTGDLFELAKIAAAKEKLDVLKNPTVSYQGQKYYLVRVHEGMKVTVDNEQKVCRDDRICRTAYELTLTPGVQSERMVTSGLTTIDVLFQGDTGQELRAYATLAVIAGNVQRSANTQFKLVATALREKYGTPSFVPRWRSNNGHRRSYEIILSDMYELFGIDRDITFFWENSATVWARNLTLLGDIEASGTALRGSSFLLLYWDHKAASHIFDLHQEAIEDFQKRYLENKKQALAQFHEDF